jgi:hypothetical protein
MEQIVMTHPDSVFAENQSYTQRDIDNYPIIVRLLDGTTIRAYLSNLSYSGLQIKCKQLSAHILTPKSGLLAKEDETDVKISLILPIKNKLKKIVVNCKLKYVAVTKDSRPEYAYAIGLQITDYKGKSFQIIKEILDGLALPDLKSNVVPIKDS